jgi:transposase
MSKHVSFCGGKCTEEIKQKFAAIFFEPHEPHRNTVRRLIDRFRETGSVADAPRSGRPLVLSGDKVLNISDRITRSPKKSSLQLLQQAASHDYQHRERLMKILPVKPIRASQHQCMN